MIIKKLEGHQTLLQLLEVSKQFHDLVVPVIFRGVTLTERLIETVAHQKTGSVPPLFQRLMSSYTQHVAIRQELDWPSVLLLLASLNQFRLLT